MKRIKQFFFQNKIESLLIIIILFFAAYIRLDQIRDYQVFLGDQGRDVLTVKRMLVDHDMTFLGPTSSVGGFFLGPFYYYLMALPLALSNLDPVGPAVMVALFSVATTWLVYSFGRRFFSREAGIIAGALFAASRLVIEYARSSWNPNVLPFFSMLMVYMLALLLEGKTRHKNFVLFVIGACMGIIIQLHYAVWGMYVFALLMYILYCWKETFRHHAFRIYDRIKELFLMGLGFGVFLGPFIAFEIYHGFPNTMNIFRFVFYNRGGGFSGGYTYEFIVRDTVYRLFLRLVAGGSDTLAMIAILISLMGLIFAGYLFLSRFYTYGKIKGRSGSFSTDLSEFTYIVFNMANGVGYVSLVAWLLCGVMLWGFYKKSIYDYYYSYMYALPILLLAAALGLLMHLNSRRLKARENHHGTLRTIATVASIGLVLVLVVNNYRSLKTTHPGMQVKRAQWVAEAVLKHKGPGPYNFALITPGNSDHAYRYFLEIWGYKPMTLEEEVTSQLMVFCEPDVRPCEPEGNSLWEVAGFGPSSIVGQWEVIGLPLYRLEHNESSKYMEGKPAKKG